MSISESPRMDYEQYLRFFNNKKLVIFDKDDLLTEDKFSLIKRWLNE